MAQLRSTLAVVAMALAVSACQCQPGAHGTLGIAVEENGTRTVTGFATPARLDFGQLPMGGQATRTFELENTGTGTLVVEGIERSDGDPVRIGAAGDATPVFTVAWGPSRVLPPGASVTVEVTFTPPVNPAAAGVEHQVDLAVRASRTAPGQETAHIILSGASISPDCTLPTRLDFAGVARGETETLTITLRNTRAREDLAWVGELVSAQGDEAFSFAPGSPRATVTLPAQSEREIAFAFSPLEARDYFASVSMRAAEGCPDFKVTLIGTGLDQALTWEPALVGFGYVKPGTIRLAELTFFNRAPRPVTISALQPFDGAVGSTVFAVTQADPSDLTTLTVPKATRDADGVIVPGTATMKLSFTPQLLGGRQGVLRGNPDLLYQSSIAVPLSGVGGGPDIEVTPRPVLDLGRIAYFAGTPLAYATRSLRVRNVGARPQVPDPSANLHLGAGIGGAPWTITPKTSNASLSEICVGQFDEQTNTCLNALPLVGYNPAVGLVADGALATLDIPVRVTPSGLGMKAWDLTLFSNDADEPAIHIEVRANAVSLPPCNYTVTPGSRDFGVLTPPTPTDLVVTFKNNSANAGDICLLSNVELGPGSDPMFSLVGGIILEKELQPGERFPVTVRASRSRPASSGTVNGTLKFNVSNQSRPQGSIPLSATLMPMCLVVTPRHADFGVVQVGCGSESRTFSLLNVCTQSIDVTGLSWVDAPTAAAGTPGCAGTSPCPEFSIVSSPVATGTAVTLSPYGAPVTYQVVYKPHDTGPDEGTLAISVVQGGQPMTYLAHLRGTGDASGSATDTFSIDAAPKLDMLFVIDDSSSMETRPLHGGLTSFFSWLVTTPADFQIGVTKASNGLLETAASDHRIIRRSQSGALSDFIDLATFQFDGSSLQTPLRTAGFALAGPQVSDPAANGGLVRADASLAVVFLVDVDDYSPHPVSWHLAYIGSAKGTDRPGVQTLNAAGNFPPTGCWPNETFFSPRYTEAVAATWGVRDDFCGATWPTTLRGLGNGILEGQTRFFLRRAPDLSGSNTLDVKVNGVSVPATMSGNTVWSFDDFTNALSFNPVYRPLPGDTVTVAYPAGCY